MQVLPSSEDHDAVLCAHVTDLDLDGKHEIILGTYGSCLLTYQLDSDANRSMFPVYKLAGRRQFPHPIYGIQSVDLNSDGLRELVVITMFGIHVFQTSIKGAQKRCTRFLQALNEIGGLTRRIAKEKKLRVC